MKIVGWIVTLAACAAIHAAEPRAASVPDFSGVWLPDAGRAEAWPAELPLAPVARRFMENFNPSESDPTTLCMPFGTPRNMLQTEYPLEIVQTPQRVVVMLQPNLANAEIRRIPLNSALPAKPEPSWFGTSRGRWEGATLVIETIGLRDDSLVSESGIAHSGQLRVIERLRVLQDAARGRVLVDDIELHDPQAYTAPLKTRRYFSWAPNARLRDPTCVDALWIDKLWRERLQEHKASVPKDGESR
jgi:hypothetical protein